jgi:hypothetical protein
MSKSRYESNSEFKSNSESDLELVSEKYFAPSFALASGV